ncbi:hypothetical protein [Achromobacter xylosoxidans]|uniref:hypothetical protein n=1 Tax=Achromobacter TaxID=222 RepID=UPI0011DDA1CC|nr:hypothetical protein [Achromobacter xylosoxidans]
MTTPVLFLDDASSHPDVIDRARAEQTAKTLLSTLKRLKKINNRIALNTAQPISQYQIAEDWTLQAVLGGNAYREEWDFIRSLSDRSPFSAGLADGIRHEIGRMEFRTKPTRTPSGALAWATLLESATVSFDARPDWSLAWVETVYCELDDDGNLLEAEGRVKNASQPAHADEHLAWLKQLSLSDTPSASQIWSERTERFPGLRFLPRVEGDLGALDGSGAPFLQAVASLEALARDVTNWEQNAGWPQFSSRPSPEGEQRRRLCWVLDEGTGKKELFDWHVRFTGSFPGRVHFRVDGNERSIVVAYVGYKLTREISS